MPVARARGRRTRGKRDIRLFVSARHEPRNRHRRVLVETPGFSAPCPTECRGPGSHTSSDDSSPHPVPVPSDRGIARMLANRQDAQSALANVDHGLLGGLAPRLLRGVSRSEGENLFCPSAESAMLPTTSAFYFLNPSVLKHYRDIISGSFYPEKHWHKQKITKCYQDARLNPTLRESLFLI